MTREPGWECPKCARIWAPRIAACGACNARQTLPEHMLPRHDQAVRYHHVAPEWNFTADDLSYAHQGGDPA
jgi:uncharacterized OB-fold protein